MHREAPPKELGCADAAHDADIEAFVDGKTEAKDQIEDGEDGGDAPFAASAFVDAFVFGHSGVELTAKGTTDGGSGIVDGIFFPIVVGCACGDRVGARELSNRDAKADPTAQKEADMAVDGEVFDKAHIKSNVREVIVDDLAFARPVAFVEKDVGDGFSFAVGSVGKGDAVPPYPKGIFKVARRAEDEFDLKATVDDARRFGEK